MRKRAAKGGRGGHQVALTVRAPVRRDRVEALRLTLEAMGASERGAPAIPFSGMDGVHFARLVLLEDSVDLEENLIPASLLYMAELDAPLARHVDQLAGSGGAGLDATFGECENYPAGASSAMRAAFLY